MTTRISCITLAVDDLQKSLTFYHDGLGLPAPDSATLEDRADHLAMKLPGDLYLVLILRDEFANCLKTTAQTVAARGSSECVLSYFTASKEEVDAIINRVVATGGSIPGQPAQWPWGYAGYVTDPDGHVWEIMWNPALQRADQATAN